jgi:hypothetical protein
VKVTDEHVHDSKMLPQLIECVTKSKNNTIDKLFAECAYDDSIFEYFVDKVIFLPCIKVRKNARIKWKKGNIFRNLLVLAQKKIFKNGKIAKAMTDNDGMQKLFFHV